MIVEYIEVKRRTDKNAGGVHGPPHALRARGRLDQIRGVWRRVERVDEVDVYRVQGVNDCADGKHVLLARRAHANDVLRDNKVRVAVVFLEQKRQGGKRRSSLFDSTVTIRMMSSVVFVWKNIF